MENGFRFLIYGFALFRLAEMLVIDDGPFDIFMELRGLFLAGPASSRLRRTIGNGLSCVYCMGIWLAVPLTFLYYYQNNFIEMIVFIFALSGFQSILAKRAGRS